MAALFLLIATVAVLAAMASSLPAWSEISPDVAIPNVTIGLLGGALIGGTIGIHYERRVPSTAVGIAVGAMAGVVGAALSFSNFNPLMAFVQCGVLVALAVAVRITTPGRSRLRSPAAAAPPDPARHKASLTRADRPRLLLAVLMGGCTLLAIVHLVQRISRADLSHARGWMEVGAGAMLVLASAGIGGYLLWSGLSDARPAPPQRSSPWDD